MNLTLMKYVKIDFFKDSKTHYSFLVTNAASTSQAPPPPLVRLINFFIKQEVITETMSLHSPQLPT